MVDYFCSCCLNRTIDILSMCMVCPWNKCDKYLIVASSPVLQLQWITVVQTRVNLTYQLDISGSSNRYLLCGRYTQKGVDTLGRYYMSYSPPEQQSILSLTQFLVTSFKINVSNRMLKRVRHFHCPSDKENIQWLYRMQHMSARRFSTSTTM